MSKVPPRRPRKAASDEDEAPPPEKPTKRMAASATSSAASSRTKKPAAAADDDGDFPKLDFDMGDLESEMEAVKTPPPVGGGSGASRKSRFPKREMPIPSGNDSGGSRGGSRGNSKQGSRLNSRQGSPERQNIPKMEELDRWRWATKYTTEGDQDEIRLAENARAWSKVVLPDEETIDVAATMMFRKYLWKNKALCRNGIPPQHRLYVWEVLSGAKTVPDRLEHLNRYQHYLGQVSHLSTKTVREIAQDIPRALNAHPKFVKSPEGQEELRRVLSAFAIRSPAIGYVNSLSHIAAFFLLYYQEESVFWILCALVDIVLPPDYFSQSLLGVRADSVLMKILIFQRFPKLHQHFTDLGIDTANFALKWLMTLYLLSISKECIARVFDVMFLEGSNILISLGLAYFHIYERDLLKIDDLMEMHGAIGKLGSEITNNDDLMKVILKEARCKLGEEEDKRRQIERAVMENSYMKELQKTQLHRKQEAERLKEEAEEAKKQIEVQDLTVGAGTEMYKIGAHGDAKLTTVVLEKVGLEWIISWKSKRKKDDQAQMKISTCTLHFGLRHGNFKLRPEFQKKFANSVRRSFSLLSDSRSLDLVCQTREDMEAWKKVFYRSGFPLKNAAQVAAHRRRIEKKKTMKRLKLEKAGKSVGRIESSDSDYEHSPDEADEARPSTSSALGATNGTAAAAASSSSSSFAASSSSAASAASASSASKDGSSKDAAEERKMRMRAAASSSAAAGSRRPRRKQEEDDDA